jgi:hypothetical protein
MIIMQGKVILSFVVVWVLLTIVLQNLGGRFSTTYFFYIFLQNYLTTTHK